MNFWLTLKVIGYPVGIYVLSAIVFLFSARLKKDEAGNLILDQNARHFKVAYPFRRHKNYFQERLREQGIGLCHYFAKLFWMLILGWPIIFLIEAVKFCLYNVIGLLFGYYLTPNLMEAYGNSDGDPPVYANVHSLGLGKLFPIYIVAPSAYAWSLIYHRGATLHATLVGAEIIGAIVLVVAFIFACVYFANSDKEEVSLVRERISAKAKEWCPTLILK